MIKKLTFIGLIISVLAMVFAGCNDSVSHDERLMEADSLLRDSGTRPVALDSLTAITAQTLTSDADKAYHSLLVTQARYLNYIRFTAADDSVINIAVDFFKHRSGDTEKLTRSYLYKGTVMEDLGRPDSAIYYYKSAEASAGQDDPFNRGYAQYRMGKLYTNNQAYDGREIEKLEAAVASFREAGDNHYLMMSLKDLGAQYRYRKAELAEETLNEAIALAEKEESPSNLISCLNTLAYLYFMQGEKDKSYNYKAYEQLQRIKALKLDGLNVGVYTTFASVYANLGKPDSAEWFLQLARQQQNNDSALRHSNVYLESLSQVAKARGNLLDYFRLSHECDSNSFSAIRNSDIVNIMYSELSFDQKHQSELEHARRVRNYILFSIVAFVILSLLLLAFLLYRRSHRYDQLVIELKDQSQNQMNNLTDLQNNISEMKINDERLKGFILSHTSMMRDMIEACYHEPNNRITENVKRIVKFQDSNRENWEKLYDYIDLEHNNIMTLTRENYPQLNDRDLLLLALTCMGYSYIQTAIVMGYSNATSVSVLKQRLARKMNLDCSLNEYIDRYSTQK